MSKFSELKEALDRSELPHKSVMALTNVETLGYTIGPNVVIINVKNRYLKKFENIVIKPRDLDDSFDADDFVDFITRKDTGTFTYGETEIEWFNMLYLSTVGGESFYSYNCVQFTDRIIVSRESSVDRDKRVIDTTLIDSHNGVSDTLNVFGGGE